MWLRVSLLFLASLSAACADQAMTTSRGDRTDSAEDTSDTDDDTVDSTPYLGPHFFRVDGQIGVVSGNVDIASTVLTLEWLTQNGEPFNDDHPACTPQILESAPGPAADQDLSTVYAWWQLSVLPAENDPCPWDLEALASVGDTEVAQFVVGLGSLDPRLAPALKASGAEGSVYGAYVLLPGPSGDRLITFGAAGTHEQWSGTDNPVEAAPLPDGRYELRTLVLLPVAEAGR